MNFDVSVKNGTLSFFDSRGFRQYVEQLKDGEYYISIKRKKKARSLNQNAYYWGVVVRMISEETGYSTIEVHKILLMYAFGFEEKKMGDIVLREPIRGSSDLSTVEFEFLARKSREFASIELGLFIPEPNEDAEWVHQLLRNSNFY